MLQQGIPVSDVAYYYGDHVPNFAQLRKSDPAHEGAGYDYDVVTAEVILNRMKVNNGRLVLPDGVSYRLLALPERTAISLPVLRKLKEFVDAGATVVGPRPASASGLTGFPASDAEVKQIVDELWGRGRIAAKTAREELEGLNIKPDFQSESSDNPRGEINFIHRRGGGSDIYFVANRSTNSATVNCTFRVADKAPELWDAVSGEHHFAKAYSQADGMTKLPLKLNPCGSQFIVFREPSKSHPASKNQNAIDYAAIKELSGPWMVAFDPKWGGPASVQFDSLVSWPDRAEPGIKYYSGTAIYRKDFEVPNSSANQKVLLDLGNVRELAEVKVNGQSCGVIWAPPFRVDITRALKPGLNQLEIEVVNFWPNRIIGDQFLPEAERLTRTNIRQLTRRSPLMPSGLMGPVRLLIPKVE
jgi:hypothetical protein